MLQPTELHDVSVRFPGEIADLRKFLSKAAVQVGTAQAAGAVALRVSTDRGFHRDLMSHIWVLLDESDIPLRSADLLGIVTIAAAGVQAAEETDEDDAHTLLRFLMEAKHALRGEPARADTVSTRSGASGGSDPDRRSLEPNRVVSNDRRRMPDRSADAPLQSPPVAPEPKRQAVDAKPSKRRAPLYAGVALGLLLVLLLGYFALRRSDTAAGDGSVQIKSSVAADRATRQPVFSAPADVPASEASGGSVSRGVQRLPSTSTPPSLSTARSGGAAFPSSNAHADAFGVAPGPAVASAEKSWPEVPPAVPSALSRAPVPTSPPAGANGNIGAPLTIAKSTKLNAGPPVAIPAEALTARLDSPRMPGYASDPDESGRKKYPRLLRRHAGGALSDGGSDPALSAELRAPDLSSASALARNVPAAAARGVVHSTCLGMMAGNLVYGPAPSYPAAAASAHVQGEVKIQATVDRDGSINAARVVSGPPLLRDAALDAVQHWRYKPFMSGGKPAPTGTMAVINFELP